MIAGRRKEYLQEWYLDGEPVRLSDGLSLLNLFCNNIVDYFITYNHFKYY